MYANAFTCNESNKIACIHYFVKGEVGNRCVIYSGMDASARLYPPPSAPLSYIVR